MDVNESNASETGLYRPKCSTATRITRTSNPRTNHYNDWATGLLFACLRTLRHFKFSQRRCSLWLSYPAATTRTIFRKVWSSLPNDQALQHGTLQTSRSIQFRAFNWKGQWSVISTSNYVPSALVPTINLCRPYRLTMNRRSPRVRLRHCWHSEGARNPELKTHKQHCKKLHKRIFWKPTFSHPPVMESLPAPLTIMAFEPCFWRYTCH